MCPASPGSHSRLSSLRAAAEVDCGARERVVHRHDRVAVAGDARDDPRARRRAPPERQRRVLGRVVVAGLEVSDAFEHEVEAGVERELLDQVVVQAGSGSHSHAPGAVEREPHRQPRFGGRAQKAAAPAAARRNRQRPVEDPRERLDEYVVVRGSRTEALIARSYARTTTPLRSSASPSARPSSTGT